LKNNFFLKLAKERAVEIQAGSYSEKGLAKEELFLALIFINLKMTFLGEVESAIRLCVKSWFGDLAQRMPFWAWVFFSTPRSLSLDICILYEELEGGVPRLNTYYEYLFCMCIW